MTVEAELQAFRSEYYELFVALFWKEPDGECLGRLADGIAERVQAARSVNRALAEGWQRIQDFLAGMKPADAVEVVADEYVRLFIGPHEARVDPYECFYLTGRLWDRPLAELRRFLKSVGIEKREGFAEPEDFLAFELQVMHWLVGKEIAAADEEQRGQLIKREADFLASHLLVWAPTCAVDIARLQNAVFYPAAGTMLEAFLAMEGELLRDWGFPEARSLEEARKYYGALSQWRGPTFEDALERKVPKTPNFNKS